MTLVVKLDEAQSEALGEYCRRHGITADEALGNALKLLFEGEDIPVGPSHPFGSWGHKDIDSVEFQRALRDEWER